MDIILGIDFGTTNTVISYFDNNQTNILMDGVFKTIKSKIGINNGIYTCGNYIALNNDKIIHNFKTNIGTDNNLDNILLIFFSHLKKLIYKKFPNYKLKTVITVPSNFNDLQREIIKNNFINAGFTVIRIINEPSAAALAYGLTQSCVNEEKILVLDLGGGTMDISILLKDNDFFEIIHSYGINDLGGNNFTQVIYDYIINQYSNFINKNQNNNININSDKLDRLWYLCQNAKEKLTWVDNYEIKFNSFIYNLNIKKFENLCNSHIEKLSTVLKNIYTEHNDIKYIIMVGNSSKIPLIKKTITDIFNITPWLHPNPESVVAEGACLYGAILENIYKTNKNVVLMDILPLSLGIETIDGSFSVIIPKDTPLPIRRTQKYTTNTPMETSIKIKVYQGERLIANKNTLIGEFIFDNITPGGKPIIGITFKVDSNSIITVTVTDKKSGVEKNILIKDINKLSEEQIESIIKMANINNKIDEEEMIKYSRIYLLNTKIETAMNNIKLNHLLEENKKQELLKQLYEIDLQIENSNNIELLNLLNKIDNDYLNLIQNNIDADSNYNNIDGNENPNNIDIDNSNNLKQIMIIELKDELNSKITFLLNKNPEWKEFLDPILDKLTLSNISLEYLQDKLNIIKDLEDEKIINYYEQFKNICLFIKTKIEEKDIDLSNNKLDELSQLINISLALIFNSNEDDNIDWENELEIFNKKCYLINS